MPPVISAAVEGATDEAVARRLIVHAGGEPGVVYGKNGKSHLRERIQGFNNAARHAPWLVLVDLDDDEDCASPLCAKWVPTPAPQLCFRVAVRAVEAWLLADADSIAAFLGIARGKVPSDPDGVAAPKQVLVNLARTSRRKVIREEMVPSDKGGRSVGPAYTSRMIEFVTTEWCPTRAAAHSDSLRRAIACLERLVAMSP
jgi:hypothetical protein